MRYYTTTIVYWHGERLDSSEPVHDESPEFQTPGGAEAWGRAKVNTPSPWPGRDYDDHFEVTEWTEGDDDPLRRWMFEEGTLTETLIGDDLR